MKNRLQNYLNDNGQVKQWPAKYSVQILVLQYLIQKFEFDTSYSEYEVNETLKRWHTFDDWAILRRAFVDDGFMARNIDGTDYRRLK